MMIEWYKKCLYIAFFGIGINFLPVFALGDTVTLEFTTVLHERIVEYFDEYAYTPEKIQQTKKKLEVAAQGAENEWTRLMLDDLLIWMETTYTEDTDIQRARERDVQEDRYQLGNGRIDISLLQQTRLEWVNSLRAERGRMALHSHDALEKTAAERSETMRQKGSADHRRFADSSYYDYGLIEQWFADRGVEFLNVSRATFTENVGRGTFRCAEEDCTQEAVEVLRGVFDFYVREEGGKGDAHRRTLIHPFFTVVGLGVSVDEAAEKLYMTTHYGTQVK